MEQWTDESKRNDETYMGLDTQMPFAVFRVSDNYYGVSSNEVQAIEEMKGFTPIADNPVYVLGVTEFRGSYIPIVSLRALFGLSSQKEEMAAKINIDQRIRDHQEYVEALERFVRDGVPFTKTEDPSKCAFGRWRDAYNENNNEMVMLLNRVDAPHKAVHEAARDIRACMDRGDREGAAQIMDRVKNRHVPRLMGILGEIRQVCQENTQEVLIIVDHEHTPCGLLADSIVAVERLREFQAPSGAVATPYILCMAKREREEVAVMALNSERIRTEKLRKIAEEWKRTHAHLDD